MKHKYYNTEPMGWKHINNAHAARWFAMPSPSQFSSTCVLTSCVLKRNKNASNQRILSCLWSRKRLRFEESGPIPLSHHLFSLETNTWLRECLRGLQGFSELLLHPVSQRTRFLLWPQVKLNLKLGMNMYTYALGILMQCNLQTVICAM